MRTRVGPRPPVRGGFTLVELLVVISLIAILLALSAGAFFRIQSSQNVSTAEATLSKLHSLMDSKYKITLDDARKTVPKDTATLALFGNEAERVQVVWTYAKLKNEMPMTFREVVSGFTGMPLVPVPVATTIPTPLVAKKVFQNIITPANLDSTPLEIQSAALFHVMISQTASGGTMNSSEGTSYQTTTDAGGLTYYVDAWGKPIAFVRHARNVELNRTPYARVNKAKGFLPNPNAPVDVVNNLDTGGRMYFRTPTDCHQWVPPNLVLYRGIRAELNIGLTTTPDAINFAATPYAINFDKDEARFPTLVSAGANNDFRLEGSTANIADTFGGSGGDDDSLDNLLSYRLRTVGARGN